MFRGMPSARQAMQCNANKMVGKGAQVRSVMVQHASAFSNIKREFSRDQCDKNRARGCSVGADNIAVRTCRQL